MKDEIPLKEFIETMFEKRGVLNAMQIAPKIMELEALAHWFNVMYGIELEITVGTAQREEGRFYGKGLIEEIENGKL